MGSFKFETKVSERSERMVKKVAKKAAKRTSSALKKEVDVKVPLPDNKFGKFLGKKRSLIPAYFRNSWREVKKVKWPTRRESIKLTFVVIIFTAFFTVLTAVVDAGFSTLVERIIL